MTVYVCKTCGRAIKAEQKPNYCYHDRTPSIENISDEDSVRMQLFSQRGSELFQLGDHLVVIEFPGDVRFNPLNGEQILDAFGFTLTEYQESVMRRVLE